MSKRSIQRHSLQTRITHGLVMGSCVWLAISGLFVFVPPLANAVGGDVVQAFRISHRVIGLVFILAPIISAIMAPVGFKEFVKKYFKPWTKEDFEFMKKFVPYMLGPKRVHMPDQDEVKSGQVIADGMLIISGIIMAISGLVLWLGTSVFNASAGVLTAAHFVHDLFFLVMVVFVVAHAYLGVGIFQPYRGTRKLMFGNGRVSESDALYHWGFWARKELESGEKVVEEEE